MSLPACQQRALNRMEGALQASEPHLASMYAIFARLNAGEPIAAESLARRPPLRRGPAGYAVVLIPVMAAVIVLGGLLGGSARGAPTCGGGDHTAGRGAPLVSRASCPADRTATGDSRRTGSFPVGRHQPYEHRHAPDVLKMIQGRRVPCRSTSSGMRRRNC
jgi:hypothetical protein